jgi:hypothetical protein
MNRFYLLLGVLLLNSPLIAQTTLNPGTYSVPAGSTLTVVSNCPAAPAAIQTVACAAPLVGSWAQTRSVTAAPAPTCWVTSAWSPLVAPAGACTTPTKSYSVYTNGVLGGGDGNWVANFDNPVDTAIPNDTGGKLPNGALDLKFTAGEAWGIWMPYSNNPPKSFPMASYKNFDFDVQPPSNAAPASVYFVPAGDESVNLATCGVTLPLKGTTFTAGTWVHVTIPLSSFCINQPAVFPGANVYKFGFQDQSGKTGVVWRLANVVFD